MTLQKVNKLVINISVLMDLAGDVDYDSGPYNVSIPAEETHVSFKVLIRNDAIIESNEYFILAIIPGSLSDKVMLINPDETNIIIVDDDG